MLIVMLVLLMATGAAMFAVHATTFELGGAGNARQALQTKYVAETGVVQAIAFVDKITPRGLMVAMRNTTLPVAFMAPFNEPELAPGKQAYRLYFRDVTIMGGTNWPMETDPTRGPSLGRTVFTPDYVVDINDTYTFTGAIPGARVDGGGSLRFMGATYTSHGLTRISSSLGIPGVGDYLNSSYDTRRYHEGASDARAQSISGPFGN